MPGRRLPLDREILHALQKIAAELHEIRKALTQAQEEQPPEKEEDYAVRLQELRQKLLELRS